MYYIPTQFVYIYYVACVGVYNLRRRPQSTQQMIYENGSTKGSFTNIALALSGLKTEAPHHLASSTKAYKCPGQLYVYIGVFLHLLPATERLRIVYYRNRRSSIEFYKLLILFHNCLAPFLLLLLSRFNSQYNNHLLFLL